MPGTWRIDGTSEGVVVHGEVDLDTASEFEAQASEAVMLSTAGTFLIDLSDVTFLDSAGLQALLRVLEIGCWTCAMVNGSSSSHPGRCSRSCACPG